MYQIDKGSGIRFFLITSYQSTATHIVLSDNLILFLLSDINAQYLTISINIQHIQTSPIKVKSQHETLSIFYYFETFWILSKSPLRVIEELLKNEK